jgi:hypothetical protein
MIDARRHTSLSDARVRPVAFLIMLGAVGAMACFQSSDGDLGFHLATARAIWASGQIPSRNVLSFAEPQHVWLLHQWLPALGFELLWRSWGIAGVIALKMLVVMASFACAFAAARALGSSPLMAAGVCLFGAAAGSVRFENRPYLFTHLSLSCVVWAFAADAGGPRRAGWHLQLWAAGAIAIGCQLHAGAIDGAIVLGLCAVGTALEPWRARWLGAEAVQPAGILPALTWLLTAAGGLGAGALALTIYHPWGARVLLFPLQMASHAYWGEHLVEFRHAWALPASSLAAYWVWLALAVLVLGANVRRCHLGLLLASLAYAVLSLRYARMIYAFVLVSAPLMAASIETLLQRRQLAAAGRAGPQRQIAQPTSRLALVLLPLLACLGPAYVYRDHTPGFGLSPLVWPLQHFAFIRAHALRGRAFVSDAWAGAFLGMFYPERQAFFDGRLEAYSDHFAREVYQRIRYGQPGWDRLLDQYRIEFVLLRYTSEQEGRLQGGQDNLRQKLAADPRFSLVNFDDVGELFVRRAGENAAVAATYAIPGVDPDRRRFLSRPAGAAPALLHAAQSGNRSATLLGLAALALVDYGDEHDATALADAALAAAPDDAWVMGLKARLRAH